jgi:hypothetical protein
LRQIIIQYVFLKISYFGDDDDAFNQNPSRAKKEADKQPLVITEHEASYVLVTYADFTTNWRKSKTLLNALADRSPDSGKDFERERLDFSGRDLAF